MRINHQTLFSGRLEVKYLIDQSTRTALARDLAAFMQPDKHADSGGSYLVRSLYFDTPDYMAYHDKMAGVAVRHKLRARVYGEDPSQMPHVRLEVKSRYLSYIQKITISVSLQDYREIDWALKSGTLPPAHLLSDDSLSREFFRVQRQYNMGPKIIVQYHRQAFERVEISRVRVNLDDELLATRSLNLLTPLQGASRLLQYGHAIFEIKVDSVMPYWLHTLIAKYNLQNQALSKYCYAVRSEGRFSNVR
jgi:SPX domain protein involved in polyphosphate accumulation